METRKIVHDFSELNYDDILETPPTGSADRAFRAKPYPFLFAALAVGLFIGFFARRR
ncbi:MAG: hypothetical protein ABIP71_14445 [Verrucomicrobiota bacterium]